MAMTHVDTPRLRIHIRHEGRGPRLLYLGGSGFDLSLRAPIFDSPLVDLYEIVAADPRGLGLTDAPPGDWTMTDYADDALALSDALGWDRAHVLGESFGAMTALHLAAAAPDRIDRLCLSVGAAGGAGGQSFPIHQFQDLTDPRARAVASLTLQDRRFADLCARDHATADAMVTARIETERAFLAHAGNATGYLRLLAARAGHDCWDKLPDIPHPTLILSGRYDDQSPLDRSQAIDRALRDSKLRIIDDGHGLLFRHPDAVQAVRDHLAAKT
ncbi:alpha/beta fold hydrolase [Jannaschia sp. M317]|uniref:alpha/beta fold hydrolase n=1 Tax=Jannaschia sp. M317 TaxID=2867011 RepID=UPI0021A3B18C|nr:alpha/beta hydrolase [Jannaschia sp. M317]UWQ16857.1 alpha/beta hydrolase [Jannaschia sp. M317]